MTARYPTYALIVGASAEQLLDAARRAYRVLRVDDDDHAQLPDDWEIAPGTKQHAALWDYEQAGDGAYELAPLISRWIRGPVYVAQLQERLYGVYVYVDGAGGGAVDESPERLAERLGVPFPPRASATPDDEWSVVVVEGAKPEDLRESLDLEPEDRDIVKIEPHALGAIVYALDGSSVGGIGPMVHGPALASATAYVLERSRGDLLQVWIYRRSVAVQYFSSDESVALGPPSADRVWEIKGANDPPAILAALHVPPAKLGW
jgi:hypothetical protein